ncbi:MAG TPA: NAD-dependent epimerase/dehydratase family protein [Dongiaceae bacterium]|nr:NAD-dependent epimerase/dehydratase family protein [Dongiaceae bacterium]
MTARPVLAVTGATGFIGQALLDAAFADNWQPRILARRYPRDCLMPGRVIEVVPGDLNDSVALGKLVDGATAIVHLAGLIKALHAREFLTANAGGTERILRAAQAVNPAAAFLYVSSLAAREADLSPYAASKWASEEKVRELAGSRPWAIIRPPAVYGPGDTATLPLFRAAHRGLLPYPAPPNARVSLIHVDDLVAVFLAMLRQLQSGGLPSGYLAEIDDGYPGGHDWTGMLAALRQAVGHPIRSLRLPRWLVLPVAATNALLCRLRGRADVFVPAKLAELYHADWAVTPSELPKIVGWQPRFDLEKGFSNTFRWYRDHSLIT